MVCSIISQSHPYAELGKTFQSAKIDHDIFLLNICPWLLHGVQGQAENPQLEKHHLATVDLLSSMSLGCLRPLLLSPWFFLSMSTR